MSLAAARPAAASVVEAAPAKINLALHVTGRRADGYHLLDTLAVFAGSGDRVTVRPADRNIFSVSGPFADAMPRDGGNLVERARDAFFSRFEDAAPVAITLEKNLPVASGLGGGSADAAATLRALARLFRPGTPIHELASIGLPLGADVPMCLVSRPLLANGIGEGIEKLGLMPALALVLVNPGIPVSTPAVFGRLESCANPALPDAGGLLSFSDVLAWLRVTRNDLEAPAITLAPEVAAVLQALQLAGAAFARMSGSGATCFGLFGSLDAARHAAGTVAAANPGWWVVADSTRPAEAAA